MSKLDYPRRNAGLFRQADEPSLMPMPEPFRKVPKQATQGQAQGDRQEAKAQGLKLSTLKPRTTLHQTGPAPLVTVGWSDDRRKSRHERGYGTAWDKLRLTILERDMYLCQCQDCKAKGLLRPATQVDHIISKAEWKVSRGTLKGCDDPSNLAAINAQCHKRKTEAELPWANGRR